MLFRTSFAAVAAASLFALGACAPSETANNVASESQSAAPAAEAPPSALSPSNTVVQNAQASPDHTTLVTAVSAAGLVDTLSGAGPFTVFAPTNAAFAKLPAGTLDTLTQPANRAQLTGILTYHVVPGRITAADLVSQIQAGNGRATVTTVQGAQLTATQSGSNVILTDARGGTSTVTATDIASSNGVIHVIDTVLMPPA